MVAGPPGTSAETRREESLRKGSAGHEQTGWASGLFGGSFLKRDVQDKLLVGYGPHIVLSSVLDLCVRDSVEENE